MEPACWNIANEKHPLKTYGGVWCLQMSLWSTTMTRVLIINRFATNHVIDFDYCCFRPYA